MYQEISVWAAGADCLQLRDDVDGNRFLWLGVLGPGVDGRR